MEISTSAENSPPISAPTKPVFYRFWRGVIRLWFAFTLRKIRVLHQERLKRPEPALLMVCHPASFLDALILVAAFERQVRCVIPAILTQGLLPSLAARGLGMISSHPENRQSVLEECCSLLTGKAALVTFVEPGPAHPAGESKLAATAASIAAMAEGRHEGGLGLKLFPVHLFLPVGNTRATELLIDVDQPESAQVGLSRTGANRDDQIDEVAKPLERRCQENSFRLHPAELAGLLGDLENALRDDFQEKLASHPGWKQKQDGFRLSRFVAEWVEELNHLHPGLLVSLRESLDAWREARRVGSLHRLEVQGAGAWLSWPVGRGIVWLESVIGFVVASYGLLNHLVALAVLYLTGLLKKESGRDKITEWAVRGLVVVACYAVQVSLVAHFWGRRAAGYYAPSLPLTGLYLWRYAWLLRHRTRLAFLSLNLSAESTNTQRRRRDLLHEINAALDHRAEQLGLPH